VANKTASLVWYCKTEDGWKRFNVVKGSDGRIRRGVAIVAGEEREYPEGRYQIRSYVGRRVVYENVTGPAAAVPEVYLTRKKTQMRAVQAGKVAPKRTLRQMVSAYVRDCENRQATEAAEDSRRVLDEFMSVRKIAHASDITRGDVLAFHKALRSRGCSPRTVFNKDARLRSFLKFAKVKLDSLPPKPKYEKKVVTTYGEGDVGAILQAAQAADPTLSLALEMALKLGLREQEVMYAEWGDVDQEASVFRVQGKERWGFKVKDSEQREVPVPTDLLERLREHRSAHPKTRLIVGTAKGRPNGHFLRGLKRLAKRVGLNCGACRGCRGKNEECQQWTLHKLRRTYATALLRAGVDVRTVQAFAGHADLETTLRYLRPASAGESQQKINSIKWGGE
jgi:integrase